MNLRPGMTVAVTTSTFTAATGQPDDAPDNEFEPTGHLQCNNEENPVGLGYVCTARKGHAGKHMGWWAPGRRDKDATW
jgi:hypothetical protein